MSLASSSIVFSCTDCTNYSPLKETAFSKKLRITGVVLGILTILTATLILTGIPGISQVGAITGWVLGSLGGAAILCSAMLKAVKSPSIPTNTLNLTSKVSQPDQRGVNNSNTVNSKSSSQEAPAVNYLEDCIKNNSAALLFNCLQEKPLSKEDFHKYGSDIIDVAVQCDHLQLTQNMLEKDPSLFFSITNDGYPCDLITIAASKNAQTVIAYLIQQTPLKLQDAEIISSNEMDDYLLNSPWTKENIKQKYRDNNLKMILSPYLAAINVASAGGSSRHSILLTLITSLKNPKQCLKAIEILNDNSKMWTNHSDLHNELIHKIYEKLNKANYLHHLIIEDESLACKLIEHAKTYKCSIDLIFKQDKNGDSPLHIAIRLKKTNAFNGFLHVLKDKVVFLRILELKNNNSQTPFEEAILLENPDFLCWFLYSKIEKFYNEGLKFAVTNGRKIALQCMIQADLSSEMHFELINLALEQGKEPIAIDLLHQLSLKAAVPKTRILDQKPQILNREIALVTPTFFESAKKGGLSHLIQRLSYSDSSNTQNRYIENIFTAIEHNNREAIKTYLNEDLYISYLEQGFNTFKLNPKFNIFYLKDRRGFTPVHHAILSENEVLPLFKEIRPKMVNLSGCGEEDETLLHWVAGYDSLTLEKKYEHFKKIVNLGTDPSIINRFHQYFWQILAKSDAEYIKNRFENESKDPLLNDDSKASLRHLADVIMPEDVSSGIIAKKLPAKLRKELLAPYLSSHDKSKYCQIHYKSRGLSPIQYAFSSGDEYSIEEIIKSDPSSINVKLQNGDTLFHWIARWEDFTFGDRLYYFRVLINVGADPLQRNESKQFFWQILKTEEAEGIKFNFKHLSNHEDFTEDAKSKFVTLANAIV